MQQRHHADFAPDGLPGVRLPEPRLNRVQLAPRVRERDAGLEARDDIVPMRRPAFRQGDAHPTQWQPEFAAARKSESPRHHTHDGIFAPAVGIHGQHPAENVGVASEMSLPQSMTQHGDAITLLAILLRQKRAAQQRLRAEGREQAGRSVAGVDLGRGVAQHEVEAFAALPARTDGHIGEHRVLRAPIEVIRPAHPLLLDAPLGTALPQRDQPVRLGIRQRPEQHAIDDAEDRRVRPDAQREREHGDGGEAGVLQQLAEGEFEVLHFREESHALNLCAGLSVRTRSPSCQKERPYLPSGFTSLCFAREPVIVLLRVLDAVAQVRGRVRRAQGRTDPTAFATAAACERTSFSRSLPDAGRSWLPPPDA